MKNLIEELLEHGIDAGIISMGAPVTAPTEPAAKFESDEDIKLSAKAFRSLMVAHVAEKMMNESIDSDELETLGLMEAKKLTPKGKNYINLYLPTLYAS